MSDVRTERLRLVPITERHADELSLLHRDPAVAEWHGGEWTEEYASDWARRAARAWADEGVHKWIAYRLSDGALVGRGGLSWHVLDGERHLELGWTVLGGLWGNGYATEIGRAGLAYAFERLSAKGVVAFTERHNRRSRAVMERLGMRYLKDFTAPGLVEGATAVQPNAPFVLYGLDRDLDRPVP